MFKVSTTAMSDVFVLKHESSIFRSFIKPIVVLGSNSSAQKMLSLAFDFTSHIE